MVIQPKEILSYIGLMIVVTLFPIFIGDATIDFKLFVHDFSEPGILRRFSYHLALMIQPTVLSLIILRFAKGKWHIIALITFLWFCKDCIDVIVYNNTTGSFFIDVIGYSLIVIIVLIWARQNGTTRES